MADSIKGVDLIISLLGSLNEKEIERVRMALGEETKASICDRMGHKYKFVNKEITGWLSRPKLHFLCEKCGGRKTMTG